VIIPTKEKSLLISAGIFYLEAEAFFHAYIKKYQPLDKISIVRWNLHSTQTNIDWGCGIRNIYIALVTNERLL